VSAIPVVGVCHRCARRAWLLASLSPALDQTARDPDRLFAALELGDAELIAALGGEHRERLQAAWERFSPHSSMPGDTREPGRSASRCICRHHCAYPPRLAAQALAPDAIKIGGDLRTLYSLGEHPLVAIVGAPTPSDYGLRSTGMLARDLAVGGVTVACTEGELGAAARAAALQVGGRVISIGGGGGGGDDDDGDGNSGETLDESASGADQASRARGGGGECRIREPILGERRPAWSRLAGWRALVLLADLVILVESAGRGPETACVELAESQRAAVAVIPGPIDSPLSRASNALLHSAEVVCNANEALDLLSRVGGRRRPRRRSFRVRRRQRSTTRPHEPARAREPATPARSGEREGVPRPSAVDPRLASVLGRVAHGEDTLAKLCAGERSCDEIALALTELELLGLLRRSEAGHYLPLG
jgi:predicted Rossmann fold nucleotide-binding protein DprA/Smf involved in DNA uptake